MIQHWTIVQERELAAREAKIPESLKLPQSVLNHLPQDITDIPRTCGLLSEEELNITERYDAVDVRDEIAAGRLTSVQVVTAFAKRAAIVHQLTNCLTDFWLEQAISRAKELDEHYESTGSVVGPLHGLPISFKDFLFLKGRPTSASVLGWVDLPSPTTTHSLLSILEEAGAVFYCKTTVPQAVMHLCSRSFWGITRNPFNLNLTSGGSSSGEGVLVAMKGCTLGNGTDGGGSIRNPAGNCGVYGFKPTAGLLPYKGYRAMMPGHDINMATIGPLAHSTRDLELYVYTVLSAEPWKRDLSLAPVQLSPPWSPSRGGKWRIGYMISDGIIQPHPPIARGMQRMLNVLSKREDVELIEYSPWEHSRARDLIWKLYYPDGGRRIRDLAALSGEPIYPLTEWSVRHAKDYTNMHDFWDLIASRDNYRAEYFDHFEKYSLDVLLMPVGPATAEVLEEAKYWGYTCQWNLLNYPAGVFPTGLYVDPELDKTDPSFSPLSEEDQAHQSRYLPHVYSRAPISLQLVGGKWQDAKVLGTLRFVESILKDAPLG